MKAPINIVSLLGLAVLVGSGAMLAFAQTAPSAGPTTHPVIPSGKDKLDAMLKPQVGQDRVLQPLADPPKIDQATGTATVAPGAPQLNLIREGSWITDRRGRLTKDSDGQMEFVFESDGRAMKDPPLIILPNLKLMAMENAGAGDSRDVVFRITGQITEYKGRNYVLLEKVLVQQ
jgi:hypothetical protein